MRKNMLRLFTVIIVSFLIASMCIKNEKTFAEELETPVEDEDIDQYEYINNAYCSISISSGSATVSSEVYGYNSTTSTCITVYLDQLINGTWHRVTSWSHSGGQNQTNSDSTTVSHGTYKVWMSVTASDGNGSESFNVDGNTATY